MKVAIVNHPDANQSETLKSEGKAWSHQVASRLGGRCDITVFEHSETRLYHPITQDEGVKYHSIYSGLNNVWNGVSRSIGFGSRQTGETAKGNLPWVMRLARKLRQGRYEIIHVQDYSAAVPTLRSMLPNAKIVLHLRSAVFSKTQLPEIEKRLIKCNLVVGSSRFIRDELRKSFPKAASRITYIPSGVDVSLFHPDPEFQTASRSGRDAVSDYRVIDKAVRGMLSSVLGNKFESGAIDSTISATVVPTPDKRRARLEQRILYIGDISPEQGIHDLIDAFSQIAPHFPQATLELVGQISNEAKPRRNVEANSPALGLQEYVYGDYMEHLRKRIPENLWRRIKFTSSMPESGLARRYRQCAMVVNPSYFDGSLMSLIEAGASGKPTIATRTGSTAEVVLDGDTGFLIKPGDVHMLARSMGILLMDLQEQARMGRNARVRVKHLYRWNPVVRATLECWESMLNHRQIEKTMIQPGFQRNASWG